MTKIYDIREADDGSRAIVHSRFIAIPANSKRTHYNCYDESSGEYQCQVYRREVDSWLIGAAKSENLKPTKEYH